METSNLHDYFVNLRNKQIEKETAEQTKKVQKYLDKKKLSLVKPSPKPDKAEPETKGHPCIPFFKHWFKHCESGTVNLRFFGGNKPPRNEFVELDKIDSIPEILTHYDTQDCYFGVALRDGDDGTKGGIYLIPGLWFEHDNVTEEVLEKILTTACPPSIIVQSSVSSKLHIYYLFKNPLKKDGIGQTEDLIKRLISYFGGDTGAKDASRVLRIPGTKNLKRGGDGKLLYEPTPVVRVVEMSDHEYDLSDFDWLPEIKTATEGKSTDHPEGWQEEILKGVSKGERNSSLVREAGRLIAKKLSRTEILSVLMTANQNFDPPLDETEVIKILDSVSKTDSRNKPDKKKEKKPSVKPEEQPPEPPEEPIDINQFSPMSVQQLTDILGLTIIRDETNKVITFLCMLSAYTEDSQINISFNAPSSTGKTYIPMEEDLLFPTKDVLELGYCSPMSFFHDYGIWDADRKSRIMNLENKIVIFLDQPHNTLLERLRPILSHDRKEIQAKITDKSEKSGTRTKNIIIRGFPAVVFCSAGLKINEQEATRFLLLSPEMTQEKIRESIHLKMTMEADREAFKKDVENNQGRQSLKLRIRAIKQAGIKQIKLHAPELTEGVFKELNESLRPRHMRDVGRVVSLIKALALLNLWFRKKEGTTLYTNNTDVEEGFKIWNNISEPQELNLPPYIYDIYQRVVVPLCVETPTGIQRKEILRKHYLVFKKTISDKFLNKELLPMLDYSGLIREEPDPSDKRVKLIFLACQSDNEGQI